MKRLTLLLLLGTFIGSLTVVSAQTNDPNYNMDKGLMAYRQGDYTTALRFFDRVVMTNPNFSEVYEYRGNIHFVTKDYRQAELDYTKAIESHLGSKSQASFGVYKESGIAIIEPSSQIGQSDKLAFLYNNRGAARYFLGDIGNAKADFSKALEVEPNLTIAQENLTQIGGKPSANEATGIAYRDIRSSQKTSASGPSGANTAWYAYGRPLGTPVTGGSDDPVETSQELRDERIQNMQAKNDARRRGYNPLKPIEDDSRRDIGKRGKTYKKPDFKTAAVDYLRIDKVKITPTGSEFEMTIENTTSKTLNLSVAAPTSQDAFFLTDRTGKARYRLLKVEDMAIYPQRTKLKPGDKQSFTLTFEKIADTVMKVNLIEGMAKHDAAWNFYGINLKD